MKEKIVKNKKQYLINEFPFTEIPKLKDRKYCLHCDSVIKVGNFKVFQDNKGEEFICCPNSPECNGTVIDWMPVELKNVGGEGISNVDNNEGIFVVKYKLRKSHKEKVFKDLKSAISFYDSIYDSKALWNVTKLPELIFLHEFEMV